MLGPPKTAQAEHTTTSTMAAALYAPTTALCRSAAASSRAARPAVTPALPAARRSTGAVRVARSSRQVFVKASSEDSPFDPEELLGTLKEKWDATENKTTVLSYGAGAVVALWASSTIVGAINSVPLLPKLLELVGLTYTGWFVYRYLLFKESREELVKEVNDVKAKITGSE